VSGNDGRRPRRVDDDESSDSVAGIVILVVGLLVVALGVIAYFAWPRISAVLHPAPVVTSSHRPSTTAPAPVTTPTPTDNRVPILQVASGMCFEQQAMKDSGQTYIWPIDCTKPHNSEVFYADSLPAGDYPDQDGWVANVKQYCHPAFKDYVGLDFNESRLDVYYVYPPQAEWNAGDRILVCYAVDPAGDRTSTVAGTKK